MQNSNLDILYILKTHPCIHQINSPGVLRQCDQCDLFHTNLQKCTTATWVTVVSLFWRHTPREMYSSAVTTCGLSLAISILLSKESASTAKDVSLPLEAKIIGSHKLPIPRKAP